MICILAGCVNEEEPKGPSLEVGDPLPAFSVAMDNGEIISNISFNGKVGMIVFFNTACPDCRRELPVIQKIWEEYKDNDKVNIIAIAREESATEIEKYWLENNLTIPYSPQENREVYSLFAPSIIPRIYITNTATIITFMAGDTDLPSFEVIKENLDKNLGLL